MPASRASEGGALLEGTDMTGERPERNRRAFLGGAAALVGLTLGLSACKHVPLGTTAPGEDEPTGDGGGGGPGGGGGDGPG